MINWYCQLGQATARGAVNPCLHKTLRERVQKRAVNTLHVPETDLAVLDHQLAWHDSLADQEEQYVFRVTMDEDVDFTGLMNWLIFS